MQRVLRLPDHGRLLVGTDLQGNLEDFQALHEHFTQCGDDAQLLLTGDLVHGPSDDVVEQWPDYLGTPYQDRSPELIDAFLEARARAPGRVHCLLGNHDHAHLGGPVTAKFHPDEAAHLEARLGPEGTQRLKALVSTFPLIALAPCGAVMLHAAPSARLESAADFEGLELSGFNHFGIEDFHTQQPLLGPLLWSRMARPDQSKQFLAALGGTVALYGHDIVREGYEKVGDDQLCFSTSFGLYDEAKVYVELDLSRRYPNVHALRNGIELKKLYPNP